MLTSFKTSNFIIRQHRQLIVTIVTILTIHLDVVNVSAKFQSRNAFTNLLRKISNTGYSNTNIHAMPITNYVNTKTGTIISQVPSKFTNYNSYQYSQPKSFSSKSSDSDGDNNNVKGGPFKQNLLNSKSQSAEKTNNQHDHNLNDFQFNNLLDLKGPHLILVAPSADSLIAGLEIGNTKLLNNTSQSTGPPTQSQSQVTQTTNTKSNNNYKDNTKMSPEDRLKQFDKWIEERRKRESGEGGEEPLTVEKAIQSMEDRMYNASEGYKMIQLMNRFGGISLQDSVSKSVSESNLSDVNSENVQNDNHKNTNCSNDIIKGRKSKRRLSSPSRDRKQDLLKSVLNCDNEIEYESLAPKDSSITVADLNSQVASQINSAMNTDSQPENLSNDSSSVVQSSMSSDNVISQQSQDHCQVPPDNFQLTAQIITSLPKDVQVLVAQLRGRQFAAHSYFTDRIRPMRNRELLREQEMKILTKLMALNNIQDRKNVNDNHNDSDGAATQFLTSQGQLTGLRKRLSIGGGKAENDKTINNSLSDTGNSSESSDTILSSLIERLQSRLHTLQHDFPLMANELEKERNQITSFLETKIREIVYNTYMLIKKGGPDGNSKSDSNSETVTVTVEDLVASMKQQISAFDSLVQSRQNEIVDKVKDILSSN